MNRRILLVCVAFAAFLWTVRGVDRATPSAQPLNVVSPPGLPASGPAEEDVPSIRIEHEVVEVPLARPRAPRAPAVAHVPRRAARQSPPSPSTRVARLILGDGRYRPEPFPRPR
jgi:hypothetical protein